MSVPIKETLLVDCYVKQLYHNTERRSERDRWLSLDPHFEMF